MPPQPWECPWGCRSPRISELLHHPGTIRIRIIAQSPRTGESLAPLAPLTLAPLPCSSSGRAVAPAWVVWSGELRSWGCARAADCSGEFKVYFHASVAEVLHFLSLSDFEEVLHRNPGSRALQHLCRG